MNIAIAARPRVHAGATGSTKSTRDTSREREIDRQANAIGDFVNSIALLRAIDRSARDDAIFAADGGDFVGAASYIVRPAAHAGGSILALSEHFVSAQALR